jgi:molybdopterin molybdotransferase
MITVQEAEALVLQQVRDYGTELVPLEQALGRVLEAPIRADRDMPPFNRVTMDGIAIRYSSFAGGQRMFPIQGTQAAGEEPLLVNDPGACIEIMTGAALPEWADTVIRYEDVTIRDGHAHLQTDAVQQGQFIHARGRDRKQQESICEKGKLITPALMNILATVGQIEVPVKKWPAVAVIATGDELVEIAATPSPYQIRSSNRAAIYALLKTYGITAHLLHLPDDPAIMQQKLQHWLTQYHCLLLSGGVSMGKFDHLPGVLQALQVTCYFHKVQQRPGKPFWFGGHASGSLVFAFPGNPVSTFLCMHRYFLPWLEASSGISAPKLYAQLTETVSFTPPLQYFLQVQLTVNEHGQWMATPLAGNGSGDLANLADTDAFMELPAKQDTFNSGEVYRIWPFKK